MVFSLSSDLLFFLKVDHFFSHGVGLSNCYTTKSRRTWDVHSYPSQPTITETESQALLQEGHTATIRLTEKGSK